MVDVKLNDKKDADVIKIVRRESERRYETPVRNFTKTVKEIVLEWNESNARRGINPDNTVDWSGQLGACFDDDGNIHYGGGTEKQNQALLKKYNKYISRETKQPPENN